MRGVRSARRRADDDGSGPRDQQPPLLDHPGVRERDAVRRDVHDAVEAALHRAAQMVGTARRRVEVDEAEHDSAASPSAGSM